MRTKRTDQMVCLEASCPAHCCRTYAGFEDRLQSIERNSFSEIILLPKDVECIINAGRKDLIKKSDQGHAIIATKPGGECLALDHGRCGIYESRPSICRAYPLYLDIFTGACELKECSGVREGRPNEYSEETWNSLFEIYEYWLGYYRKKER